MLRKVAILVIPGLPTLRKVAILGHSGSFWPQSEIPGRLQAPLAQPAKVIKVVIPGIPPSCNPGRTPEESGPRLSCPVLPALGVPCLYTTLP